MGLSGVSYNESFVGSLANPAHWGNTVYGLGTGGVQLRSYNATDSNNSVTNSNFSINQFQLQLPIVRGKFGVSGSFKPLTRSNFRTYRENTRYLGVGASQDTLLYGIENRGSGGINRAELGFGWRITPNISVGYAASAVFMSMDNSFTGSFANNAYNPVDYSLETSGVGYGSRFGTYFRMPDLFAEDDQLGLGATLTMPVSIDAERVETSTRGSQSLTSTDGSNFGEGTIKTPMEIRGGVSYRPGELMMFASEITYEGWSGYENDFNPSGNQQFVDRYKWGLGFQYFPYMTGSDQFLSSFKYRIGTSYDTGHLRLEGQRINTLMFSLGLGILSPGSNSNSSIDISLEYGLRGTTNMNLVEEQIWGVSLSVNLAELMFFRPKLQ